MRVLGSIVALAALTVLGMSGVSRAQEPKRVAFLVGINKYQKPFFETLKYAERDVTDTETALKALGFQTTVLTGSKATREAIDAAVTKLVKPLTQEDVVLVLLCGHGQQMDVKLPDGTRKNDAFYCPFDAVASDPTTLYSLSHLIDDQLAPNVGRKLVLVDACRNDPDPGRGRGVEGKVIALPEDTAVMFSCRKGQRSFEHDDLQHGLFTYCVLEGLRGTGAKEGEIAWSDLVSHVNRRMASRDFAKYIPDGRKQEPIPAGGVPFTVLGKLSGSEPPPELLKAPFTPAEARAARAAWARSLKAPEKIEDKTTGATLVLVPPGEFQMGNEQSVDALLKEFPSMKKEWFEDAPRHRVRITRPFYVAEHEVTKGAFAKFVATGYKSEAERDGKGGYGWTGEKFEQKPEYTWKNPGFTQADTHPVVNVSWNDAVAYCNWLSTTSQLAAYYRINGTTVDIAGGPGYRLLSEAEWEYCCRAGTTTQFASGADPETLALVGNVADATAKTKINFTSAISAEDGFVFTAPVGRYRSSAFDLFDMHGNVNEWCEDGYDSTTYEKASLDDPRGPSGASDRVIRGGSWGIRPAVCRSASRGRSAPEYRHDLLGFRLARSQSSR